MVALFGTVTLLLASAPSTSAQGTSGRDASDPRAAPPPVSVPSDHWVYPLLDQMAADGLLDGVWLPGRRPVDARAVAAALDSAAARAGVARAEAGEAEAADGGAAEVGARSPWARTASEARTWLTREYGGSEGGWLRALPLARIRASDGPRTDPSAVILGADLRIRPTEDTGVWWEPVLETGSDGVELPVPRLGGAWRAGAFRLGASYEARRLGPGAGGGIVLHDRAELGWVEAGLAEPVILPWIFRYLGPFRISAYGSRLGADSIGPGAGFFAGDFAFQPHPRVTIGGHRSAVIVSEVDGERITFGDVLNILFDSGRTIPNFEDQKLSFGGSVRTDLFGLTVTPYFVWGIEDTWELERDPGAILGAWVPAIPTAVGPLGLRYEYTAFGDPGENLWPWHGSWEWRNWYRHGSGRVLYVDNDGDLLGHPLGGYGTEHRLEASLPLPASGLLLSATLFTRHRDAGIYTNPNDGSTRPFSNILHDEMPGRSHGGTVAAVYSTPGFRVDGELGVEVGREGWDRVRASVGGKWLAW